MCRDIYGPQKLNTAVVTLTELHANLQKNAVQRFSGWLTQKIDDNPRMRMREILNSKIPTKSVSMRRISWLFSVDQPECNLSMLSTGVCMCVS